MSELLPLVASQHWLSLLPRITGRRLALIMILAASACAGDDSPPRFMVGTFVDDYGSHHQIADTLWYHGSENRYRIVAWLPEAHHLLAINDSANPSDGGLWDRIDWVKLPDGSGWEWAFCISTWNAHSREEAERVTIARIEVPRTGCAGHPFTRMRRVATTSRD